MSYIVNHNTELNKLAQVRKLSHNVTQLNSTNWHWSRFSHLKCHCKNKLECGPMSNVMVALPNTGGALCSTLQSLAEACY